MAAAAVLTALCLGTLSPCDPNAGPECVGHYGSISLNLALSPDASMLWTDDKQVRDTSTWLPVKGISDFSAARLGAAAFSPNGEHLAAGDNIHFSVRSVATGAEVWGVSLGGVWANRVQYSPDGTRIALALYDRPAGTTTIAVRSAATGSVVWKSFFAAVIDSFSYTADGSRIVVFQGGAVALDAATGAVVKQDIWPGGDVRSGATSPDGRHILLLAGDNGMRMFDAATYLPTFDLQVVLPKGDVKPYSAAFSPDSSLVVISTYTSHLHFFSTTGAVTAPLYSYRTHGKLSRYVAWASTGGFVVASGEKGVAVYSLATPAPLTPSPVLSLGATVHLVAPSGTQEVVGVRVGGADVVLPVPGISLSAVPVPLQGSSAHATRVAVGEKLRLSCGSGRCDFVVALYSCKRCADAANDFEAQLVVEGFTPATCAPSFSVTGGAGRHVMRSFSRSVSVNNPVVLEAVVHATDYVVVFQVDAGLPRSWCPPKVFSGPSPPCQCVTP